MNMFRKFPIPNNDEQHIFQSPECLFKMCSYYSDDTIAIFFNQIMMNYVKPADLSVSKQGPAIPPTQFWGLGKQEIMEEPWDPARGNMAVTLTPFYL